MSKQQNKEAWTVGWQLFLSAIIFIIITMFLAGRSFGGTYTKKVPVSYGVVEPDTFMVRVLSLGDASQVGSDSIVTSFPDTLLYTLDSAKAYEILKYERWYGSGVYEVPTVEGVPMLFITATASVDYAQAADSVDSQLTATHGAGSWQSGAGGTGSDTLIFYASDTGNNNRVEGVQITMYAIGGTQIGSEQITDASGKTIWALTSGDTILPIVYGPYTYNWELPTLVFTGQTADSAMGYKTADPPAAATAPYVAAYFDGGAGFVDSATGLMIARTNVTYYCQTVGARAFADDSWGIVPQMQSKRPDANGRVTFLVVANLFLKPPTNYYRFWFEAHDGTTRVRRTIRNFVVDSLPDPVNILQAIEVFPGN